VTDRELATLRALTARLVPGPPEDPDPGALEVCAAEAIARLLSAFSAGIEPPIHAARDGGFIALDPVAELGWRIRLEGSKGLPEREFAGPVTGLAERVRDGLAELDAHAHARFGSGFADAGATDQDKLLEEPALAEFVELAMTLTLDAVYGDPAYGGNSDRAGWKPLGWPGFTQPHGFTPEQVSRPDRD
jgi:gluconate 2-dehydrogenase gamma chain